MTIYNLIALIANRVMPMKREMGVHLVKYATFIPKRCAKGKFRKFHFDKYIKDLRIAETNTLFTSSTDCSSLSI